MTSPAFPGSPVGNPDAASATAKVLSISEVLASRAGKPYLTSLASHGYEMGVGRAGEYAAHAHRGFTDIAFAPGGMRVRGCGGWLAGSVHITAPGHWFGPLEFLSGFWFIKFFESASAVCSVPDKVIERVDGRSEGCLVLRQFESQVNLHAQGGDRILTLRCHDAVLAVEGLFPDGRALLVCE